MERMRENISNIPARKNGWQVPKYIVPFPLQNLHHCLAWLNDSQLTGNFPFKEHLLIYEDIFDGHNCRGGSVTDIWWVEARNATKHLILGRIAATTIPKTNNYST